jgi:hypothetical protein
MGGYLCVDAWSTSTTPAVSLFVPATGQQLSDLHLLVHTGPAHMTTLSWKAGTAKRDNSWQRSLVQGSQSTGCMGTVPHPSHLGLGCSSCLHDHAHQIRDRDRILFSLSYH